MGAHQEADVAKPTSSSRKRKESGASLSADDYQSPAKKAKKANLKKAKKQADDETELEEKRLRRFRPKPPVAFEEIYRRATTQRFFVLSRQRGGTPECPKETVQITGTTGNIYTIVIARQPSCDCPQGTQDKQCKHIIYVMARVLRAKDEYVYQLALLSSELRDIFARAPPADNEPEANGAGKTNNRKPLEGDCPICFNEMEAQGEAVVWCKAACGQNIHKECFEMWAATKRQQAGAGHGDKVDVTCPYCRSVWQGDEDMVKKIEKTGPLNAEGYVNVAEQLGISDERDPEDYSRWWPGHPRAYKRRT